ncbi:MAG: hypothetical protein J0665_15670 [Deltaproteobacteria bacterium]|jgi:hypothetical protein|nr:hypothetical protein [Deltaproteobacteria bacterium]
MRRSVQFLLFTAVSLTLFLLLPLHARHAQQHSGSQIAQLRRLQLTDLCLATEARYTRHPALADHHAPFQEHPLALEHFPSGSLILPSLPESDKP